MEIDSVRLNFNPGTLVLLNVILGLVMFGVSLDLKIADFRNVLKIPRGPIIGWVAQFVLLPAATYLMTLVIEPAPSIALGMMLVAACPGGNISNFIAHLSRGNTALSVSMTAISTAFAVFMTPFNITFWGSLNPATAALMKSINLDPLEMFGTVFLILGIPLIAGMYLSEKKPKLAHKLKTPFRYFSLIFFLVFVLGALAANWQYFVKYVGVVALIVAFQNASALALGYFSGRLFRLSDYDSRAVAVEVGIQNSGLGLTLIFSFFDGLGGMAIIAAWWGIWHIISGLTLAGVLRRIPPDHGHGPGPAPEAAV